MGSSGEADAGLEKLVTWQKAMALAVGICKTIVPTLPPEERYALADQLRRSVQSIPANIAEGHGRFYFQEGIRFCYYARGSLEETHSHLSFARQMGYLSPEAFQKVVKDMDELRRLLNGYIGFLKKTKRGGDDQNLQLSIRETTEVYETGLLDDELFS